MIQLTIPGDPNECSPNKRVHYLTMYRRRQQWKSKTALLWKHNGHPILDCRVRVDFIIRRGRRIDPDNAVACLKGCIDGLKCALVDDSERWLELGQVKQEVGATWRDHPEVVVTVTPLIEGS